MGKRDRTEERLTHLLRNGDPVAGGSETAPDPRRRAALLTRCSESLSNGPHTSPSPRRTRLPLMVGALTLSASLIVLFLWAMRPQESPPVPQVAVIASPLPPPAASGDLPRRAGGATNKPGTTLPTVAIEKPVPRKTPAKRIATRRRNVRKHAPTIAIYEPFIPGPHRIVPPQPKPMPEPKPAPEYALAAPPVVEKVILISDDTPLDSESEPDTESVIISITENSQAVIVSRPLTDKTRR